MNIDLRMETRNPNPSERCTRMHTHAQAVHMHHNCTIYTHRPRTCGVAGTFYTTEPALISSIAS